jgi:hypothetical protein
MSGDKDRGDGGGAGQTGQTGIAPAQSNGPETLLSRRDLIKLGAAATLGASIDIADRAAAQTPVSTGVPAAPGFFTPEEFAMVDELSELIIPTDDHSPGARAARVAAYIDSQLAIAWEEKEKSDWREGLRVIEQLSREIHGKPFMQSSDDQRFATMTRMAQNEGKPQTPAEIFFAKVKFRVVQAYYTSEIGIKQDMDYKGNSYLTEFVGFDVS